MTTNPTGATLDYTDLRPVRPNMTRSLLERLGDMEAQQAEPVDTDTRSFVDTLLRDAWRERASDVHIDPHEEGAQVRFRVDGALLDVATLTAEQARRLANGLKTMVEIDPVTTFHPIDARRSYTLEDHELALRLSTTPCLTGEKITIRLLDPEQARHDVDDLGLSEQAREQVKAWIEHASGMFLVVGPTGTGKTTTLYALLHHFKTHERSAITIEDPVEYPVDGVTQIQVDHTHELTFVEGLRGMMRHDPDYLMVGEVRDDASAEAAVKAAVTGKVLLTTLHARDAVAAITGLRNLGAADHQIAAILSMVVAQRLVRRLCPACTTQGPPTEAEARWVKAMGRSLPAETWHPVGCEQCRGIGYRGRIGVFELWRLEEEQVDQIAAHAEDRELRRALAAKGHVDLLTDGLAKAAAGITSLSELREIG